MTRTPDLTALKIVVTRPAGTGDALSARLRALGANVLAFPAIVIQPLALDATATTILHRAETFDFIVFVSPTAVARFFAERSHSRPRPLTAAVVGSGSAEALRQHGVAEIIQPSVGAGAEALLTHPALADLRGRRVLIVAGVGGRDVLENTLRERGADVTTLRLYKRVAPNDGEPLRRWLDRHPGTLLLATSNTTLDHLVELATDGNRRRLFDTQLVVSSPRVVKKARSLGFRRIARAADASDAALVAAVSDWQRSVHE